MVGHIITQKWLFEKRERKTYLLSAGLDNRGKQVGKIVTLVRNVIKVTYLGLL
jgi:hypothetical protein